MTTEETYTRHVRHAFEEADALRSKISDEIIAMEGLSGTKTRHFYNNLLAMPDARYLEIGTWKGSTVCSAMCRNSAEVVCIDNWSEQFGKPNCRTEFIQNFHRFMGFNNARFIEADCFSLDVSQLPKFNIYLYDGEHSAANQKKALTHYYPCLDDVFIFIVDDWNFPEARQGTREAINELGLTPIYEKEVLNLSSHYPNWDYQGWFNGLYAAVLKK